MKRLIAALFIFLSSPVDSREETYIIRPTVKGTHAPNYGAPAWIVKGGRVSPVIPGTHAPGYQPGRRHYTYRRSYR